MLKIMLIVKGIERHTENDDEEKVRKITQFKVILTFPFLKLQEQKEKKKKS
jgi:hypothetical protein